MSSFVDATAGAVEHCESMAKAHPDLREVYERIASSCQQKLWHQLTVAVEGLVENPANARTVSGVHSFLALYDKVVSTVDSKLNPLAAARIAAAVAAQLAATGDMTAGQSILENLITKKRAETTDRSTENSSSDLAAIMYAESKLSMLMLQPLLVDSTAAATAPGQQQLAAVKAVIEKNAAVLKELAPAAASDAAIGTAASVHAAHYEQAMTYYKVVGPPEAFYEQAMQFLNYADYSSAAAAATDSAKQQQFHSLAVDLCLAALTGEGVYNLTQTMQTPVMDSLKNTTDAWLVDLLQAVADGNVAVFQQLSTQHAAAIQQQPALVHRATAVQEKLTLLALVHTVFDRESHDRILSFQDIANNLQIAVDQVEWVVMRAFSVKLLEGWMDQVDQTVTVTWVMPRALTAQQMQNLATHFGEWAGKVSKTKEYVQEQTPTFA